jgi:NAD(P)-dependent dehydrogenase (short-subunit alcohol dehydrogenase family)
LILAGRSEAKVQECIDELHAKYPSIGFRLLKLDLSSQKSVKAAAAEVLGWDDVPEIHLVINNAGVMRHGTRGDMPLTEDGLEDMFGINHIGHWLFTNSIMPKVIAAAKNAPTGSVRIIGVSSSGTWVSPFRASDLGWEKPAAELPQEERPQFALLKMAGLDVDESIPYMPTAAYGQSKTCVVLNSGALNARLFEKYGILSFALDPGEIKTELARHTDPDWLQRVIKKREEAGIMHWKTPAQGASTTLVAACDPKLSLPEDDGNGQFLGNAQIAKAPGFAVDKECAEKLWQVSEELTGQKFSY